VFFERKAQVLCFFLSTGREFGSFSVTILQAKILLKEKQNVIHFKALYHQTI